MSEKRVKVEREIAEREIKVEREQILFNDIHVQGVLPEGTLEITENGDYDVYFYRDANVNVPQPEGEITITENGTYNVKDYETAKVELEVITPSDYFYNTPVANLTDMVKAFPEVIFPAGFSSLPSGQEFKNIKRLKLTGEENAAISGSITTFGSTTTTVALEEIEISNIDTSGITSWRYMFRNCGNLKRIILSGFTNPNTVSTNSMFQNCNSLEVLVIDSPVVFNLSNSQLFVNTVSIYVPDALVESYKAAQYWSSYASQIKPLSELPTNAGA